MRHFGFILVPLLACAWGCEDEPAPPPPNKPQVSFRLAQCRPVEGIFKLDRVEVHVRDLDGAVDLRDPVVVVEATRLTMETQDIPWDGGEVGEKCKTESCERIYVWEHSSDAEQILCGDAGDSLVVVFETADEIGFQQRELIPSEPL
jgi:hypothetical protein